MSKKEAYIEYKNTHLFAYVKEDEEEVPQMQTRSRSAMKEECKGDDWYALVGYFSIISYAGFMAIFITMKDVVKGKMNQHAKHFRLVSRMEAFQQKRKTYDQLDYLRFYPPELKSLILDSMQGPLPQ